MKYGQSSTKYVVNVIDHNIHETFFNILIIYHIEFKELCFQPEITQVEIGSTWVNSLYLKALFLTYGLQI